MRPVDAMKKRIEALSVSPDWADLLGRAATLHYLSRKGADLTNMNTIAKTLTEAAQPSDARDATAALEILQDMRLVMVWNAKEARSSRAQEEAA